MKSESKAKYLVVDTTGFLKNLQFQELAENVITLEDVVNEIKCHKQLKRLAVIPYDLSIKSVFPENIKTVSEFSKKTGDFPCLSVVDMKVMALTYQLEKEFVGTDHLNTSPAIQTTIENFNPADVTFDNVAGFYSKDKVKDVDEKSLVGDGEVIIQGMTNLEVSGNPDSNFDVTEKKIDARKEDGEERSIGKINRDNDSGSITPATNKDTNKSDQTKEEPHKSDQKSLNLSSAKDSAIQSCCRDELSPDTDEKDLTPSPPDDQIELGYSSDDEGDSVSDDNLPDDPDLNFGNFEHSNDLMILKRIDQCALECEEVSDDDSIYDDDDCGWITPGNIAQAKRETSADLLSDEPVTVACLTTDFAMQNVLLQMGLHVMSVDGRIIKQMRSYILRCYACGKTTSIMTKMFCPKCGLKTLKRVAVAVNPDGKQQIFINYRRKITSRGKRWSIPRPQGGKHANNPILVEDQRIPQQRLSKKAMQRTNALDPDYIAGFSPFVMKDTTSRSVMLGFHTSRQNAKHLVGRNPNKRTSRKKK